MPSTSRNALLTITATCALLCAGASAAGRSDTGAPASEAAVKAACLFHFVRFTVWPPEILPPATPVQICVLGGTEVGRALESTFTGRRIDNRPVVFRQARDLAEAAGCHILYLSGTPASDLKTLRKSPLATQVLLVGDDDSFSRYGTLLDFALEGGRVVFVANSQAIAASRVRLSSNLLTLARQR